MPACRVTGWAPSRAAGKAFGKAQIARHKNSAYSACPHAGNSLVQTGDNLHREIQAMAGLPKVLITLQDFESNSYTTVYLPSTNSEVVRAALVQ